MRSAARSRTWQACSRTCAGWAWSGMRDRTGRMAADPTASRSAAPSTHGYFEALERQDASIPASARRSSWKPSRRAQLGSGRPPRYAGTCRELSAEQRRARRAQGLAGHPAVPRSRGQAHRVRGSGPRSAELSVGRHRRLRHPARRRHRRLLFLQCRRRCLHGGHAGAARRGSSGQHAAAAAASSRRWACARRATATCRSSWAPTARRSPSGTARRACASIARAATVPEALANHLFRLGHSSARARPARPRGHGARVRSCAPRARAGAFRCAAAARVAEGGCASAAAR